MIRPESHTDFAQIYLVNKQAFGREAEAVLVERLRNRGKLPISLVATEDNAVVGHIAFSPVVLEPPSPHNGINLAPIAVLPGRQGQGIGAGMMEAGIAESRRLGYDFIVLVGHPGYYPRFGFVPARPKGLECEFAEAPDDAWMVLNLGQGPLPKGKVNFQPQFREVIETYEPLPPS